MKRESGLARGSGAEEEAALAAEGGASPKKAATGNVGDPPPRPPPKSWASSVAGSLSGMTTAELIAAATADAARKKEAEAQREAAEAKKKEAAENDTLKNQSSASIDFELPDTTWIDDDEMDFSSVPVFDDGIGASNEDVRGPSEEVDTAAMREEKQKEEEPPAEVKKQDAPAVQPESERVRAAKSPPRPSSLVDGAASATRTEVATKSPTRTDVAPKSPTRTDVAPRSPTKADIIAKSPARAEAPARSPARPEARAKSPTRVEAAAISPARVEASRKTSDAVRDPSVGRGAHVAEPIQAWGTRGARSVSSARSETGKSDAGRSEGGRFEVSSDQTHHHPPPRERRLSASSQDAQPSHNARSWRSNSVDTSSANSAPDASTLDVGRRLGPVPETAPIDTGVDVPVSRPAWKEQRMWAKGGKEDVNSASSGDVRGREGVRPQILRHSRSEDRGGYGTQTLRNARSEEADPLQKLPIPLPATSINQNPQAASQAPVPAAAPAPASVPTPTPSTGAPAPVEQHLPHPQQARRGSDAREGFHGGRPPPDRQWAPRPQHNPQQHHHPVGRPDTPHYHQTGAHHPGRRSSVEQFRPGPDVHRGGSHPGHPGDHHPRPHDHHRPPPPHQQHGPPQPDFNYHGRPPYPYQGVDPYQRPPHYDSHFSGHPRYAGDTHALHHPSGPYDRGGPGHHHSHHHPPSHPQQQHHQSQFHHPPGPGPQQHQGPFLRPSASAPDFGARPLYDPYHQGRPPMPDAYGHQPHHPSHHHHPHHGTAGQGRPPPPPPPAHSGGPGGGQHDHDPRARRSMPPQGNVRPPFYNGGRPPHSVAGQPRPVPGPPQAPIGSAGRGDGPPMSWRRDPDPVEEEAKKRGQAQGDKVISILQHDKSEKKAKAAIDGGSAAVPQQRPATGEQSGVVSRKEFDAGKMGRPEPKKQGGGDASRHHDDSRPEVRPSSAPSSVETKHDVGGESPQATGVLPSSSSHHDGGGPTGEHKSSPTISKASGTKEFNDVLANIKQRLMAGGKFAKTFGLFNSLD
ncbi:hypothetical protein HK101_007554 [Irineochytrium annulatum]|nr:hypothetical protein HK101_007554 [Irineochytrium annulatum]